MVRVGGGWAWELLHVTPGVVHGWGRARARGGALRVKGWPPPYVLLAIVEPGLGEAFVADAGEGAGVVRAAGERVDGLAGGEGPGC